MSDTTFYFDISQNCQVETYKELLELPDYLKTERQKNDPISKGNYRVTVLPHGGLQIIGSNYDES